MKVMLFSSILLFVPAFHIVMADKISWCDYWYRRGIARVECAKPRQNHWSLVKKEDTMKQNLYSMPICDMVTDWSKCQKADHCPLGLLCWVKGNPCCTPQTTNKYLNKFGSLENTCPSTQTLGIQCNARTTINWCHTDSDCHPSGSSLQKCCPSGCGYNMCLRITPPIDMTSRLAEMSIVPSQCPRMDSLNIGCSRQFGTSWCHTDSDCYSNSAQRRFCCPTRCGYNVCLLQLGMNQWAIA